MDPRRISLGISRIAAAAFCAALLLAPIAAGAGEVTAEASASAAVASRYVWRGQTLSESVVVQPTVGIIYGDFSANLWSNADLDKKEEDDSDSISLSETDLTLSYGRALGKVTATAGYIYYGLDGAKDTQEIYVTLGLVTVLNPTVSLYYDVDEGEGGFAVLGISQALPITETIAVTPAALLGVNINDRAMGVDAGGEDFFGLYFGEISIATSIPVRGAFSIDPRVAYSFGIGDGQDAIGAASVDGKKNIFYGSVALALAF